LQHHRSEPIERGGGRRVDVDVELGAGDIAQEFVGDVGKARLVGEELLRDAVDPERALVYLALRVEVAVKAPLAHAPVDELHAADLDDAIAQPRVEPGRFGIQNDLSRRHAVRSTGQTRV